jgi:hypothetical protein
MQVPYRNWTQLQPEQPEQKQHFVWHLRSPAGCCWKSTWYMWTLQLTQVAERTSSNERSLHRLKTRTVEHGRARYSSISIAVHLPPWEKPSSLTSNGQVRLVCSCKTMQHQCEDQNAKELCPSPQFSQVHGQNQQTCSTRVIFLKTWHILIILRHNLLVTTGNFRQIIESWWTDVQPTSNRRPTWRLWPNLPWKLLGDKMSGICTRLSCRVCVSKLGYDGQQVYFAWGLLGDRDSEI